MSTEAREVGMEWAVAKLRELAEQAQVPLAEVYWEADVGNPKAQVLVVASPGQEKRWEVADLDLEAEERRPQLERVLRAVVEALG